MTEMKIDAFDEVVGLEIIDDDEIPFTVPEAVVEEGTITGIIVVITVISIIVLVLAISILIFYFLLKGGGN